MTNEQRNKAYRQSQLGQGPMALPVYPKSGADLAGACEGEDIADLIDLASQLVNLTDIANLADLQARAERILNGIKARS